MSIVDSPASVEKGAYAPDFRKPLATNGLVLGGEQVLSVMLVCTFY